MRILDLRVIDGRELLEKLRTVRLKGHPTVEIYRNAALSLEHGQATDRLMPAQNYVLRENIDRILRLREALLSWRKPIDIFRLDCGLSVRTDLFPDAWMPVLPPIIEESVEPNGRVVTLINDGMHRVAAARRIKETISIVLARNVPQEYPYYAYPLDDGWDAVAELDALPEGYSKKRYRDAENYKALFRDFNAVFPGLQEKRTSKPAQT